MILFSKTFKLYFLSVMIILISNDDGINAEGLHSLEDALKNIGEVWTAAPERPQSAMGRALTLHRPLKVTELSKRRFMVNGTPSDCVNIAVNRLLHEKPDLVVSGINRGANLGDDISYSGTVAAAFEATILGIPAIASSLSGKETFIFGPAARFTARVTKKILQKGLPSDTLLNINIPDTNGDEISSYRITHQGRSIYDNSIQQITDPRGDTYYRLGGNGTEYEEIPGSDAEAVRQKFVSITPIATDLTHYSVIETLQKLEL